MITSNITRRWGRSSLTILAIAISFSMLLSLSSISLGLHRASEEKLGESPRDIVVSSNGLNPTIENSHQLAQELSRNENFSAVMPLLTLLEKLVFDNSGRGDITTGTDITELEDVPLQTVGLVGIVPNLAEGFMSDEKELFVRSDILKFQDWFDRSGDPFFESGYTEDWTGEMLLDRTIMEDHNLKKGDQVYYVNGSGKVVSQFTIKGTIETSLVGSGLTSELLGGIAVVHLGELQFVSGNHRITGPDGVREDLSTTLYLDMDRDKRTVDQRKALTLELELMFPGLDVSSRENRLYRIDEEVLVLEVFSISVAVASISIGVLFLSSIMIIDVEDRRSDISIMRAIGISRRTIFLQTVMDSLVISSAGAMIGIVPGFFGSRLLNGYLQGLYGVNIQFASFEPGILMASLIYLILLVTLFSLIPAARATTIMPKSGMMKHYNR